MQARRRHDRKKRVLLDRRYRGEDLAFWNQGRIPSSATSASICCCGSRSFRRGPGNEDTWERERDWDDMHAFCDAEAIA